MKRILLLSILFPALLLACTTTTGRDSADGLPLDLAIEQSAGDIAERLPAGARIAIVAFEAEHDTIAGYIMDELTGAFINSGIEVVDRNNLEYVLKELNLQTSGLFDDKNAVDVGKWLGATYVITGQMLNIGNSYLYRVNTINTETAKNEANVRLNVRRDRALETMFTALQKNTAGTRAAKYAVTE